MKTTFLYSCFLFFNFSVLLLSSVNVNAQVQVVKTYNFKDGLPCTRVNGAIRDNNGYLWISTPSGLSRFDGRQITNFSLTDGLPSLAISQMFQDSRGRLWVGTTAGVVQFKNNRLLSYPSSDNLGNFWVLRISEMSGNRIWAFTIYGVYEFSDTVWKKLTLYPGYDNITCRGAVELNGELYVNYSYNICCRTKEGRWIIIASKKEGGIFNEISRQQNEVWIGTVNNLYSIRDRQLVPLFNKELVPGGYFFYFKDSRQRLWISGNGYLKISLPGDWQHFFTIKLNGHGYAVNEDFNHIFWVGTEEGLLKLKDIPFTVIDKYEEGSLEGIYNSIPLPDNRMIFSSGIKQGMLLYRNGQCKQIAAPKGTGNNNYFRDPVDGYTYDDKNSLWIITRFRRFLYFDGNKLEDFSKALHLKTTENLYDLNYDKNRKQFFLCADSTLLVGGQSGFSVFIPQNTGIPIVKPTRIKQIRNGLLLLYIDGKGVYSIDSANNLVSLIHETQIDGSKKGVQLGVGFYEGKNNDFWITVPGLGLFEYGFTERRQIFLKNHFTIKDGLQSNNILSLTCDLQHRLWIAGITGLDILQINEKGNWELFNYAASDELALDKFDIEKLVSDAEGNIWLCTPDKLIKFNTADLKLYKEVPKVVIEKISLSFKETDWSKLTDSLQGYYRLPYSPVLNYTQNSLGISFNAIGIFSSNSHPEYSYKLLPIDTSWSIPSGIKSVSFANLPDGKYQFMVKAKDGASEWSSPSDFRFIITPPFWQRFWFRLLVIAMVAFIIISIFRSRIKQIKYDASLKDQLKELEMKALKAQMNPHFIYNALNSIQALIASEKKMEAIFYIGSFSSLLRQVLDNSENNVISLDKELHTIGLYIQLESLRLDMQLDYQKSIPQNIVAEFEKIPPLILQPFIENALWHGLSRKKGEKEIKISVSIKDDWLICDIADNGIGREKAAQWKSLTTVLHESKGIEITRKRLIDFNDDNKIAPIEFYDLTDIAGNACGTSVTVKIKRKRNLVIG